MTLLEKFAQLGMIIDDRIIQLDDNTFVEIVDWQMLFGELSTYDELIAADTIIDPELGEINRGYTPYIEDWKTRGIV